MPLPTKKKPPHCSLQSATILLYGRSKIGKSTFASHAPDTLFLATEPGLNALEVYEMPISSWEDFIEACKEISVGNHGFKTIVIDTIDVLHRMCATFICKRYGVEHESEGKHSKLYGIIRNEMQRVLTKLAHLPYGLILISHAKVKEVEVRAGANYSTVVPTLPDSIRETIEALVDIILYADIVEKREHDDTVREIRVLRTKPSKFYVAGDRFQRLPDIMPLDFAEFEKHLTVGQEKKESATPKPETATTKTK